MPDSEGWIKLHRKFLKWEWFEIPEMIQLFIYLLLTANHAPKKWKGKTVDRGQLITGRIKLTQETGLSEKKIRNCLDRLENTGEIRRERANKYSIITLCNYNTYQIEDKDNGQQKGQQGASKGPAKGQQRATNKNKKELKNERSNKRSIQEIIYPFDNPEFLEAWDLWKRFKKEQFRFTYKPIGEQAALKNIADLANGNLNVAVEIIHQSIKNGWQGFFAKKGGDHKNPDLTEFKKQTMEKMERIIKEHGNKTSNI